MTPSQPVTTQRDARQELITATALFVRLFMTLPRELREPILQMSAPDHIDIGEHGSQFTHARDPQFVLPLTQLGNATLRLECILALLQNSMLKLTCLRDLTNLETWLASIDFASVQTGPPQNGFDAVHALGFSDINRAGAMVPERGLFGPGRIGQTFPSPSNWHQDARLTRMCNNLHTVEVDVALSDDFLRTLQRGHSMVEAMKQEVRDASRTYQVYRLLQLQGLNVLRLHFFTANWNATTLSAEDRALIVSWLQDKFDQHGQSVQVISNADDW